MMKSERVTRCKDSLNMEMGTFWDSVGRTPRLHFDVVSCDTVKLVTNHSIDLNLLHRNLN